VTSHDGPGSWLGQSRLCREIRELPPCLDQFQPDKTAIEADVHLLMIAKLGGWGTAWRRSPHERIERAIWQQRWQQRRRTLANVGERRRTSANCWSWRSPSKRTLASRGERWRTMDPRTSKPLVGILGHVDGRIVPVAPPPVSK